MFDFGNVSSQIRKPKKKFHKLYTVNELLLDLLMKSSGNSIRVYSYLFKNYNIGVPISINCDVKESIVSSIGRGSSRSVDNSLRELCGMHLLIRMERGGYMMNPIYVWKGTYEERKKCLRKIKLRL